MTTRSTGWIASKDRYAVPVMFNPYTGEPRDVRDVQSDPQGILIVPPGKVEMLAAPTQPQAGAVPMPDEMASKAGRALSDLYATECGVDKEDNWKVYGSDFIATAKLVLEAVGIKVKEAGNADT